MKDLRDPKALGELLLGVDIPLRTAADLNPSAPDYRDPDPIEKYGRPQDIPSTLPN